MKQIIYEDCSNYQTDALDKMLKVYGDLGYELVSVVMVKNKYNVDVLRLFFQRDLLEK